jgi:hypothetical protein
LVGSGVALVVAFLVALAAALVADGVGVGVEADGVGVGVEADGVGVGVEAAGVEAGVDADAPDVGAPKAAPAELEVPKVGGVIAKTAPSEPSVPAPMSNPRFIFFSFY